MGWFLRKSNAEIFYLVRVSSNILPIERSVLFSSVVCFSVSASFLIFIVFAPDFLLPHNQTLCFFPRKTTSRLIYMIVMCL